MREKRGLRTVNFRQQRDKAKRRRRVEIEEIKILYIEHET